MCSHTKTHIMYNETFHIELYILLSYITFSILLRHYCRKSTESTRLIDSVGAWPGYLKVTRKINQTAHNCPLKSRFVVWEDTQLAYVYLSPVTLSRDAGNTPNARDFSHQSPEMTLLIQVFYWLGHACNQKKKWHPCVASCCKMWDCCFYITICVNLFSSKW